MSIERYPHALPLPLSEAVRAGGFLFLSGVVALDAEGKVADGDIRAQTRIVLATIDQTLQAQGLTREDVVKTTVWLANISEAAAFNDEYAKAFGNAPPARSAVEARLHGGARVEVEVLAWAG
ncbi:RidA family protein [Paraburkholderia sp. J12]|uniref:RidA family protein n=1 Tax=Paraburkholderia sp. J12 TaxID=2805432 RepID=UPI002ABDC505|nr:RidA family protein [Paraburkholderia sp. J12]